jgi:hypothetical protein
MTDVDGDEGFLADPETIIAAAVTVVEPHLSNATIHAAINQAATTRTQRRRLAIALTSAPELLTSGHPQGPPQIESLISALRATGAQRVTPPRCAHCGRALHLPHRDGDLRICTGCDRRRRSEPCVDCGATTSVATRDEDGRPRCTHCRPRKQPDSAEQIVTYITSLDPGLNRAALRQLICDAVPQAFQRRRVARELEQDPALLTGQAAKGSPRLNALVRGLLAAGARNVVAPACPSCGRTVALRYRIGGVRCCRRCYDQTRLEACSRCGRHTPVASRTITGKPCASPVSTPTPPITAGATAAAAAARSFTARATAGHCATGAGGHRPSDARSADSPSRATSPTPTLPAARTAPVN